jgi:hypothetical protein
VHQGVVKKNAEYTMDSLDHAAFIISQKRFKMINIETTNRCPLQCPQCTRFKLQHEKHLSSYKETKERIQRGFDLSVNDAKKMLEFFDQGVMLCGSLSDPVYWPNFFEFLDLSKNYPNKIIQIHTAASQKNIDWYKKAFEKANNNVIWIFGIDGLEDTSSIYRVGQNTKLMFEAMNLGSQMNQNIHWQYIVFTHNVHQIDTARNYAKKHNIKLEFVKSDRTNNIIEVPREWRPKKNKEIVYDII